MVGEATRDKTQTDGGGGVEEPPEIRLSGADDDAYRTQQMHDDAAFEDIRLRMANEAVDQSPVGMHFGTLAVDHQLRESRVAESAAALMLSAEEVNIRFETLTEGMQDDTDLNWAALN